MLPFDPSVPNTRPSQSEAFPFSQEAEKANSAARLILYERSGKWSAAMLRAWPNIRKCWLRFSTWAAAWKACRDRPGSFLVVELRLETLPEILRAFRGMEARDAGWRWAGVADRSWSALEWMFRQAGAVHFITSPREMESLVHIALRHLKRSARRPASLAKRIWRRLPWPKAAQTNSPS